MKRLARTAFIAAALLPCVASAAASAPASNDVLLHNGFSAFTLLTATADRDARQCVLAAGDCATLITQAGNWALIGLGRVRSFPAASLSPGARLAQANAIQAFHHYYLAETSLQSGAAYYYVSNLRQAVAQAFAAASRLNLAGWFGGVMSVSGCSAWRVALKIPDRSPCQ